MSYYSTTSQPTQPNHTGIRLLIFIGYLGAAAAILIGFFALEWVPGRGATAIGADYTARIAEQFRDILSSATGETEILAIVDVVLSDSNELIDSIITDYWSAAAMYYVVFLGVQYAISAFFAFLVLLMGRRVYPVSCLGRFLMIFSLPFRLVFNLALPVGIMLVYESQFLIVVGDGYYVTLGGVVAGGVTTVLMELIRLGIPRVTRQPQIFVTATSGASTQRQAASAATDIFADQNAPVFDDAPEFEEGKYNSSSIFPDGDIDDPPKRRRRRG